MLEFPDRIDPFLCLIKVILERGILTRLQMLYNDSS